MSHKISGGNVDAVQTEDDVFTISVDIGILWRGLLIFLATLFSHWQAIGGGFIWDDDAHITRMNLRSLQGLWDIWFKLGATQQYYPLVHSFFWFEQAFWGDVPAYYHITNIILHTVVVFLLVTVLRLLEIPGAWVAGFIFALHPVHVESVAWITEQKNTISAIFYLFTLFYYIKFDEDRRQKHYAIAVGFFVLALLSKTVTATLPAALLVVFWWKRGNLSLRRDVVPLLPFFILGISGGIFTAWVERVYIGAQGADYLSAVQLTPLTRCLLAGHVILFYLSKLIWPINLVFIYEHWTISATNPFDYIYTIAVIAIIIFLIRFSSFRANRKPSDTFSRAPLAGFFFFCGTLFPVLGFANVYPFMFSYVADHFQYLASLGIIVPVASFLTLWVESLEHDHRGLGAALGGVSLALLGFLSWSQCSMYADAQTLYRVTIERNPSCWMAHNNLGAILLNQGDKVPEAQAQFQAALSIRPGYPDARSNMCSVLIRTGKFKEAQENGEEAVRLRPTSPENHNNLGIALMNQGKMQAAIEQYQIALKIKPDYVEVLNNLGNALSQVGRKNEALICYQTSLKYSPNFADAHANLGLLFATTGHNQEAIVEYEQAVKLQPSAPNYHENLGQAYGNAGRHQDAVAQYQLALNLNINNPNTWYYLGNSLIALDKISEAETPYLNSLKLNPANFGAENNLAAVYFKIGRMPEAISHYQLAIRLNPTYPDAHSNLGVALVSEKLYEDAVVEYKKAITLNPSYAAAYNNLGLVLTTLGRNEEAIANFKKSVSLVPANPEFHENLGRALKANKLNQDGDTELAIGAKLRLPAPAQRITSKSL